MRLVQPWDYSQQISHSLSRCSLSSLSSSRASSFARKGAIDNDSDSVAGVAGVAGVVANRCAAGALATAHVPLSQCLSP